MPAAPLLVLARNLRVQLVERQPGAEGEQVLGVLVLAWEAVAVPLLARGALRIAAERPGAGVGGAGLRGERDGLAHPAVVEVDERRQAGQRGVAALLSGVAERPDPGHGDAVVGSAPDGDRGPRTLGAGGGERKDADPSREPVLGRDSGERRHLHRVAADAADGARQRAAVRQPEAHVDRGRRSAAHERLGLIGDALDLREEPVDDGLAEDPGRQVARGDLGQADRARLRTLDVGVEHPLADVPLFEMVELDRQRIVDLGRPVAQAQLEAPAQERAHRVLDEPDEVVELDRRLLEGGQRSGRNGGRVGPLVREVTGAVEGDAVEAPRIVAGERTGDEVVRVEGLERVVDDDVLRARPAVRGGDRPVHRVQELAHGDGRRAGGVRALVAAV
jgi:hypothetical protein